MELSRVTRLLLWLLSKRPDVQAINLRDTAQSQTSMVPAADELTTHEEIILAADFLEDIYHAPSAPNKDRPHS